MTQREEILKMINAGFEQMMMTGFGQMMPPRCGHTSRAVALRARMRENGGDMSSFTDTELLTHQIGLIRGTDEAEAIAENLLETFGSLKGVLEARPEQLETVRGVGARIASLIVSGREIAKAYRRCLMAVPDNQDDSVC